MGQAMKIAMHVNNKIQIDNKQYTDNKTKLKQKYAKT